MHFKMYLNGLSACFQHVSFTQNMGPIWTSQKLEIKADKSLKNDAGLSYQNNPNTNVKVVTHTNAFLMSLNLFLNYKTLPG